MTDYTGIAIDSRKVKPGYLFVALCGSKFNGDDFIADAQNNGAIEVWQESKHPNVREKLEL